MQLWSFEQPQSYNPDKKSAGKVTNFATSEPREGVNITLSAFLA